MFDKDKAMAVPSVLAAHGGHTSFQTLFLLLPSLRGVGIPKGQLVLGSEVYDDDT